RYPFSFVYGGRPGDEILDGWRVERKTQTLDAERTQITTNWTDPATGLRLYWEVTRFSDYPALEWVLYFENTGSVDTPIIEDIQALDMTFDSPLSDQAPYRLHRTNGSHANATDFEPKTVVIDNRHDQTLKGGSGKSSAADLPFFKVETAGASLLVAVGWSG